MYDFDGEQSAIDAEIEKSLGGILPFQPTEAYLAWTFLLEEFRTVQIQFQRIAANNARFDASLDAYETAKKAVKGSRGAQRRQAKMISGNILRELTGDTAKFADIRFLIFSLSRIDRLMTMLEKYLPDSNTLTNVRQKYAQSLKDCTDFRNHLEHIDERVRRKVRDLGNLSRQGERLFFSFDGKMFDVGPSRKVEFEQLHQDILTALKTHFKSQDA